MLSRTNTIYVIQESIVPLNPPAYAGYVEP